MPRNFRTALLTALALLATAAPSSAGFIDFFAGTTVTGGSLAVTDGGVTGAGISVTSALGESTAANAGVTSPVTNGVLNFSTGALLSTDAAGDRFYATGGPVTITGMAQGFTGTLLAATFSGPALELQNLGNNSFRLLGGQLTGTVAPALASFYNFNTADSNLGGFSLLMGGTGANPTVNSGNIAVTAAGSFGVTAVPEPATVAMAATAVPFGLGYWLRRRKRSAA
ncbi:MAG: PEP-CTERM sorting domain-containing protein [Planctomycetia bacterium]|nr:PEP-CTERM sorting domain-containing protein [Planctomycetia bacterium]